MDNAAANRVALAATIVDLERILPTYQVDAVGVVIAQAAPGMDNATACIAAATLLGRRFDVADPRQPPEAVPEDALLLATFPRFANNVDLRRAAAHFARAARGAVVVIGIVGEDVEGAARQIRGEPGILVAVCRRASAAAPAIVPIAPEAVAAEPAQALTGPEAAADGERAAELPKAA